MSTNAVAGHKVVSQAEWLESRKALLAKERDLTHRYDAIRRERLELPWAWVEKQYTFDTAEGKRTLGELFDGRSQLLLYHFMFGPDWEQGCSSCSMAADTMNPNVIHLNQRDVTFSAVSRAPLSKIEPFKQRLGWTFPWVSSFYTNFNQDFRVSFTPEQLQGKPYNFGTSSFPRDEAPGISAFFKDETGNVYHTYSGYARGLEHLLAVYSMLDVAPLGRHEEGLPNPMAWVRHRDRYEPKPQAHQCCGGEA
jgi:predicted dithiol-disulfide oxidoreductase (DUF899 family)